MALASLPLVAFAADFGAVTYVRADDGDTITVTLPGGASDIWRTATDLDDAAACTSQLGRASHFEFTGMAL